LSGKAVQSLQLRGAAGTFVYFDNLDRAIEQSGRVVLDLLPKIYDTERKVVLNAIDGTPRNLVLNQQMEDGSTQNSLLDDGDYDIEIDTAPSYAVQKEQSLQIMTSFVAAYPAAFPLIADLMAQNCDLNNLQQFVSRLQTLVPPDIIAKEKGQPPPPPKPNPQEQMMKMQMQLAEAKLEEQKQETMVRQQKNVLEDKKHRLSELQMMLDAKALQDKMLSDKQKDATENHKAELDYTAAMARLMHDIRSEINTHSRETTKITVSNKGRQSKGRNALNG
jgi:hypothetical protein